MWRISYFLLKWFKFQYVKIISSFPPEWLDWMLGRLLMLFLLQRQWKNPSRRPCMELHQSSQEELAKLTRHLLQCHKPHSGSGLHLPVSRVCHCKVFRVALNTIYSMNESLYTRSYRNQLKYPNSCFPEF